MEIFAAYDWKPFQSCYSLRLVSKISRCLFCLPSQLWRVRFCLHIQLLRVRFCLQSQLLLLGLLLKVVS
jgi:hypothetical protein